MTAFDFTHHRILIADTCEDTIARARTTFALKGLTNFTSFNTGEEVLKALEVFDPDVVIVGITLTDMDGLALISKMRQHLGGKYAKLPMMVMFKTDEQGRLKEASKLDLGGALRKPLDSGKLLRLTRMAIEKGMTLHAPRTETFKLVDGVKSGPVLTDAPEPKKTNNQKIDVAVAVEAAKKKTPDLSVETAKKLAKRTQEVLKEALPKVKAKPASTKQKAPPKIKAKPVAEKPKLKPAEKPKVPQKPEAKPAEAKTTKNKAKDQTIEVEEPVDLNDALDSHIHWIDTAHAEGKQAVLKAVDLRQRELSKVDLTGIQIIGGLFSGMDLTETTLRKSNLSGSNFNKATLIKAHLAVCRLKMAKFKKANLSLADLRGADLSKADLSGANLSNCDLGGAHLEGTILNGANLSTAKGLIPLQVKRAKYDKATRFPAYLFKQKSQAS